jgi:hypothetical protein
MQAMPLWERHAARLAWTAFALTALFALASAAFGVVAGSPRRSRASGRCGRRPIA